MRVLVTGATGFLGSHVARALAAKGATVRVLHRAASSTEPIDDMPVERVFGDILEPSSLASACRDVEVVVHCAAQMGRRRGLEARLVSHVTGTRNMLAASVAAGVRRFVYTSSVAALGIPGHRPSASDAGVRPMDESTVWRGDPRGWPYGYAKHIAERLVRRAAKEGLAGVILNPALVIGPGDRHVVSNVLIWHMLHGRTPPLVPGGLNVVDIADVTDGYVAALSRGRSGQRYILCGENRTHADLVRTTARLLGRRPPTLRLPLGPLRAAGILASIAMRALGLPFSPEMLRMAGLYFYYTGDKARAELGLGPPRPYEPAAAAAAEWYRARRDRMTR